MTYRAYNNSPLQNNILEIVNEVVLTKKSVGWHGTLEELEELKTELIKYNIVYTHDMLGQWELKTQ